VLCLLYTVLYCNSAFAKGCRVPRLKAMYSRYLQGFSITKTDPGKGGSHMISAVEIRGEAAYSFTLNRFYILLWNKDNNDAASPVGGRSVRCGSTGRQASNVRWCQVDVYIYHKNCYSILHILF
jgi:hypothetical protein